LCVSSDILIIVPSCGVEVLNPECAVGVVARRLKPKRNAQLEQFFDEGISVDMVREKMWNKRCSKDLQAVVDGYCKFWVKGKIVLPEMEIVFYG
jgi:hypothetical protein